MSFRDRWTWGDAGHHGEADVGAEPSPAWWASRRSHPHALGPPGSLIAGPVPAPDLGGQWASSQRSWSAIGSAAALPGEAQQAARASPVASAKQNTTAEPRPCRWRRCLACARSGSPPARRPGPAPWGGAGGPRRGHATPGCTPATASPWARVWGSIERMVRTASSREHCPAAPAGPGGARCRARLSAHGQASSGPTPCPSRVGSAPLAPGRAPRSPVPSVQRLGHARRRLPQPPLPRC